MKLSKEHIKILENGKVREVHIDNHYLHTIKSIFMLLSLHDNRQNIDRQKKSSKTNKKTLLSEECVRYAKALGQCTTFDTKLQYHTHDEAN